MPQPTSAPVLRIPPILPASRGRILSLPSLDRPASGHTPRCRASSVHTPFGRLLIPILIATLLNLGGCSLGRDRTIEVVAENAGGMIGTAEIQTLRSPRSCPL